MLGLEAWLSLIGPAYFAYIGIAIPFVVVWAIIVLLYGSGTTGRARGSVLPAHGQPA